MDTTPPSIQPSGHTMLAGHCLEVLRTLPGESVDCCITSPPYWGLRDYRTPPLLWGGSAACDHRWVGTSRPAANGTAQMKEDAGTLNGRSATRKSLSSRFCQDCGGWEGGLGLEPTPELYVEHLVQVFREVRRVLKPEATLWLVLGDSFAGVPDQRTGTDRPGEPPSTQMKLKRKDLVGIPWQVAFALRSDGWYLRSDIVWHKPNPTPESVRDRPTRAHEYVFLLAKGRRYFYDQAAIAEPLAASSLARLSQASFASQTGGAKDYAKAIGGGAANRSARRIIVNLKGRALPPSYSAADRPGNLPGGVPLRRNRRSVWTLPTHPYRGAHFATFPPELIRPCVKAGCPVGGVVIDPFMGAGTTGLVAAEEGRRFIGIELNKQYLKLARKRIEGAYQK